MAIKLTIRDEREQEQEFCRTFVQDKVSIGRARYCDICLPDLSVSTCHLEIRLVGNDYCAVDMGSLNGTYVSTKKLVAHRPKKISNKTLFRVAHYEIAFHLGVAFGPVQEKNLAQHQALDMLGSVLAMEQLTFEPALVVISGPGKASRFSLGQEPSVSVIGRSRQCEIRLDDNDVSRNHAEVAFEDGGITVKDLGSRNGVMYNGERNNLFSLVQGTQFTVGKTTLALEHPLDPQLLAIQAAPEEDTASFCASDLHESSFSVASAVSNSDNHILVHGASVHDASVSSSGSPNGQPHTKDVSFLGAESIDLPLGPSDPLAPKDTTEYVKTQEIPAIAGEEKSDLGLIVVGAIVVVLCVLALIWLLT